MGRGVGYDKTGLDHIAVGGFHANHPPIFHHDLLHSCVIKYFSAQFPDLHIQRRGKFVGPVSGDICLLVDIAVEHGAKDAKTYSLCIQSQVAPVCRDNLLSPVGHFDGIQHILQCVWSSFKEIGVSACENLLIRIPPRSAQVGESLDHFLAQPHKFIDRFS